MTISADRRVRRLAFVGPEFEVGLRHVDLRVREVAGLGIGHQAEAMVGMRVRQHDRVDVLGIDAGELEVVDQASAVVAHHLEGAEPGVEQHELVAGVEHQRVLLERYHVGRQEVVLQTALHVLLREALEHVAGRRSEVQRPVRHHGALEAAELEAVERRRLGVQHRRLGQGAGCKAAARSCRPPAPPRPSARRAGSVHQNFS